MKLQGISAHMVRNEYEYEKYVAESYRKQYDWAASKPSMPWIVIDFSRESGPADMGEHVLTFKGVSADFTNISAAPSGEWAAGADKTQLKVYPEKMGRLMLEAAKDVGLKATPYEFEVILTDKVGNKFSAKYSVLPMTDAKAVLQYIDEAMLQQGKTAEGELLYELVASEFNIPVKAGE